MNSIEPLKTFNYIFNLSLDIAYVNLDVYLMRMIKSGRFVNPHEPYLMGTSTYRPNEIYVRLHCKTKRSRFSSLLTLQYGRVLSSVETYTYFSDFDAQSASIVRFDSDIN